MRKGRQKMKLEMLLLFMCVVICLLAISVETHTTYYFPRYTYRKKQRNESKIRRQRNQCESGESCRGLVGLALTKCVRMCMSEACYEELYGHDELEEGEIDVRYNSFKGCVLTGQRATP